jgi:hypothetical protein
VGNYATLNPLSSTAMTLSNGNLDCSTGTDNSGASGTVRVSTGKWFFEATTGSADGSWVGWMDDSYAKDDNDWAFATGRSVYSTGGLNGNGGSYADTYTTNDVIGCALDLDNGTVAFYKNGVSQGTMWTGLTGTNYRPFCARRGYTYNFGQRPFAHPLSGFEALCTTNLPDPTIADGSQYFQVIKYPGNGTTQTLPNINSEPSSGLNFEPDFVWIKQRSATVGHLLYDQIRGGSMYLQSNTTGAEGNQGASKGLYTFTSDGFSVGDQADGAYGVNGSSITHAAWCWDAGGTTDPSNEAGSITSQVRANASAGFSVVTYTGNASNATVGHGLGVAPSLYIVKARTSSGFTDFWSVYHRSLGATAYIKLNSTDAQTTGSTIWNSTAPTSTVFSVDSGSIANVSSVTYVAYCFAPVAGYSSFGSYTGNGSADGPFVYTGFRPRWVLVKMSSGTSSWQLLDSARSDYNVMDDALFPNLSNAETVASAYNTDFLSNGFKIRDADSFRNGNGSTFIYYAVAENPFQYARAR